MKRRGLLVLSMFLNAIDLLYRVLSGSGHVWVTCSITSHPRTALFSLGHGHKRLRRYFVTGFG